MAWSFDPLGYGAITTAINGFSARLDAMQATLATLELKVDKMATTLDAANAAIADLTTKVQAATSLDASVAALVQAQVKQLNDLSTQISELQAGTVTQQQIDELANSVTNQANALDAGTQALQAAVPANTPQQARR